MGLCAAHLFTIGYLHQSFSKKSLLPHSRMPPKKSVTIATAPADPDAAGNRVETIAEFVDQLENCRATNPLAETIYADAAEEPPSVEIPAEFLELHENLDSDDGSIAEATISQAT